jgi:hypothetical protein
VMMMQTLSIRIVYVGIVLNHNHTQRHVPFS